MKSFSKAMRVAAAAAALAFGCATAAAPTALAEGGNLVTFGDSIPANPTLEAYMAAKAAPEAPHGNPCPTDAIGYGTRAAQMLGMEPRDYSCAGASAFSGGRHITTEVDSALRDGALNGDTRVVLITAGFNDTYVNGQMNRDQFIDAYKGAMIPQIDRIRAAAPNADIRIVGYPTMADGDFVCVTNWGNNVRDHTPMPFIRVFEDNAQWAQVRLAEATGTRFVDLKPSTANRGTCGNDGDRIMATLIDFGIGVRNLPLHLSPAGHEHVAHVAAGV